MVKWPFRNLDCQELTVYLFGWERKADVILKNIKSSWFYYLRSKTL